MMNMLNRFSEIYFARFSETRIARFHHQAALLTGALLMCASLGVHADDIADASQLFKQGQHTQALDKVNNYLANKPKDAQARFLKGLILTEQGKTAEAIKIFSALTEDYPDLPEPYNNLAVLYAGQGQYEQAKQSLELAIRTHPSYATAHENLGDIYAKMASQAYDRALQLDRSNTATQTKLAMIQDLFAARPKEPASRNREEPAAVVATASKTGPAAPLSPPPAKDNSKEILKTINAWAAAWSSKNVGKYLAFYADDFKTPDGMTRSEWEAARRDRISKPKHIQVSTKILTIQFADNDHATAKFRQSYRASHLRTSSTKTLLMARSGDKWLIQEERSK